MLSSMRISQWRNHCIPHLANSKESYHPYYMLSMGYIFFTNLSQSMMNQDLNSQPLSIFSLLEMMDGFDCANGPPRIKDQFLMYGNFANILESMMNLWLKFDPPDCFLLLEMMQGLNCYLGSHRNKIMKKMTANISPFSL